MDIEIHQIDAFTDQVFKGNPAAVCPLERWLPDAQLLAIAAENNLSETAFIVVDDEGQADYHLRWFTPAVEVDLCGHATLATGHHLLRGSLADREQVSFRTRSGMLKVSKSADKLAMNFPAYPVVPYEASEAFFDTLTAALGEKPVRVLYAPDENEERRLMAVFDTAKCIGDMTPDFAALRIMAPISVCVTAPGGDWGCDFVSRYFAPSQGINEDPVTGSNHSLLTPYWADQLGKTALTAQQISARGGHLECRLAGSRVIISGQAVSYLKGIISI